MDCITGIGCVVWVVWIGGFATVTHYEVIPVGGNELKSLLGRGEMISPSGSPLVPDEFLVPPSAISGFKGVSGRIDISKIAKDKNLSSWVV